MYKLKDSKSAIEQKFAPNIMSYNNLQQPEYEEETKTQPEYEEETKTQPEYEEETKTQPEYEEETQTQPEYEEDNQTQFEDHEETQTQPEYEEAQEINPKSMYEYDGKQYYVDNEKLLQKRFDEMDHTKKYDMNLCIYRCVRKGCCPYLTYLLVYDPLSNTYVFPNYPDISRELDADVPIEQTEESMMELFKHSLFDIYPPNETVSMDMENEYPTELYDEDLYKGFSLDDANSRITMVYDATRINVPVSDARNYCWVSPYEIFITNKMKDIDIDDSVISVFAAVSKENQKDFHHLKLLADNSIVKTPYILFMCKKADASAGLFSLFSQFGTNSIDIAYENVLMNTVSGSLADVETDTILYPRIQHPQLGNYTFFSMNPIGNITGEIRIRLRRFAVFVDIDELDPLYLEESENDKLLHLYDINQTKQYSAVSFMHDGASGKIQLWCVKSPYYFSEMENNRLNTQEGAAYVASAASVGVEQPEQEALPDEVQQEEEDAQLQDEQLQDEQLQDESPQEEDEQLQDEQPQDEVQQEEDEQLQDEQLQDEQPQDESPQEEDEQLQDEQEQETAAPENADAPKKIE
jgi:hypothetical protein